MCLRKVLSAGRARVEETAELLVLSAELVVRMDWGVSKKVIWICLWAARFTIEPVPNLEVGPALNGVYNRWFPEISSNINYDITVTLIVTIFVFQSQVLGENKWEMEQQSQVTWHFHRCLRTLFYSSFLPCLALHNFPPLPHSMT